MKKLLGLTIIGFYRITRFKLDLKEINQVLQGMTEDNRRKLWTLIKEAGDYLQGQLPDHPNHPKGRNPYAHVAICVKSKFNASYKDIEDEKFDEVVKYINFLRENPS